MTILEALKSKVQYPLSDNFFQSVMIERGLSGEDKFDKEVAESKAFRLCRADLLIAQVDAPNIQEGNVSLDLTYRDVFIKIANSIYREYGEPEYGVDKAPTVTIVDW